MGAMATRRPPRLTCFDYLGLYRYSLTCCTLERFAAFEDARAVSGVLSHLRQTAFRHGFALVAYCFMPDHLHVLAEGCREDASLRHFVLRFRQASGYWYSRTFRRRLWQDGYYDRVLRESEDTVSAVKYVLENPVRKGLAKSIGEYKWAGSDVLCVDEIADDLSLLHPGLS
jgi:putative transposase